MRAAIIACVILVSVIQPTQNQKESARTKENQQQTQRQAQPVAPPSVPTPSGQQKPANDNNLTQPKTWDYYDAIAPPTWSNWFLGLVGIGGIIAALVTLCAIRRQNHYFAKSVVATQKGAKAAFLNAQAVIDSQRPWLLIPMGEQFSVIDNPILIVRGAMEYGISHCTFQVKNFGGSPARVIEQKLRLVIAEDMSEDSVPSVTPYDSEGSTKEDYIFAQGSTTPVQATIEPDGRVTRQEREAVFSERTRTIWLCGYWKYMDTFNRENSPVYETRLCYRWICNAVSIADSDLHKSFWVVAGPREYSRAT